MSTTPGPALEGLLRRLLETPGDLQLEPRVEDKGSFKGVIHVDAVVGDTLRWLGGPPLSAEAARGLRTALNPQQRAWLQLVLLTCWLLHDPYFKGRAELAERARVLLLDGLKAYAPALRPADCATDPDRREELARLTLDRLGLRPAGEGEQAAADRLTALDSVARARVAREAAAAEKRARAIREAAAKAAAEAANYYGRE